MVPQVWCPETGEELAALAGVEMGPGEWFDLTQERVGAFAEASEDRQWIHVDVRRAVDSPWGGTIAHGLFLLSLGPMFSADLLRLSGLGHVLNYGYDRVRFPASAPVGSRVRMTMTVDAVTPVAGGFQVAMDQQTWCSATERPVVVARVLARVVTG
ncbi:putative enoyl-CoA hydratase 1 [Austwickia sp. TVS 96-490-7B]|uniref:MaoC family dehydratase n=1 Tax=Austwickia sp. TVS 96-490-7B TaxID=2830843 RepID=UPI001C57DEF6|nr:MaoC family dehydratase [Austwickia sp. TVS 96-490-7B]MBW3083898.1 putative enoyl-CoA hydratase 1 [Austwickia sp. TVS 96-490-7B]